MKILRRIGGVVVIIVSLLLFLPFVFGVFGLWAVNGPVHDVTDAIFAPIESGLTTTGNTLEKVNTHVTNARDRVSNAQDFVAQAGEGSVLDGSVLAAISETISAKLGPEID